MGSPEVVTLTAPNGMQVTVSDEKRDQLVVNGYVPVEAEKKAPAKKSASSNKSK